MTTKPTRPLSTQAQRLAAAQSAWQVKRREELEDRIGQLESKRLAIYEVSPEVSELIALWRGNIENLRDEFVSHLRAHAATGRLLNIRFDSPGAIAYITADHWLSAIPGLAARVVDEDAGNQASILKSIDDEISQLRRELAVLTDS